KDYVTLYLIHDTEPDATEQANMGVLLDDEGLVVRRPDGTPDEDKDHRTLLKISGNDFNGNEVVEISYYGAGANDPVDGYGPVMALELQPNYERPDGLVVLLPNAFRLLPGTARISGRNSMGRSNTVNLPVVYPTPFLKSVGPWPWASDPSFKDWALNLSGSDYIDVPDYFWSFKTAPPSRSNLRRLQRYW